MRFPSLKGFDLAIDTVNLRGDTPAIGFHPSKGSTSL